MPRLLSMSHCLWTRPCPPTSTIFFPNPPVSFSLNSATFADPTTYPNVSSPMPTPSNDADPPKMTPTENSSATIPNNAFTAAVSALVSLTASPSTPQSPSASLTSSVAETSLSTITNGTSTATVPTSESSTASPSLSQSSSAPLTSPRHLNVGAIAGGTVGGFVVLASLGLIVFLWLSRRRRHRIAPSAAYRAAYGSTPPPIYPRVQSIPPGHHTPLPQASEKFVVSSTRSTIFDGHRPSVAF